MTPDIFFVHKGNSWYLKYALGQVHHSNPDSTIYLLGDRTNDCYSFVKHFEICDYSDAEFSAVYEHLSGNGRDYELFCFERWFVLRNFRKRQELNEEFFYLDSDVMVYYNFLEYLDDYSQYQMTICNSKTDDVSVSIGPQYSYFKDTNSLLSLCDFLMQSYSDPKSVDKLRSEYNEYISNVGYIGGGICDMRIIAKYVREIKDHVLNLGQESKGSIFDCNINSRDGFYFDEERHIKKIFWKHDGPYIRELSTNVDIKLIAAHFQGGAKIYMKKFYSGSRYPYLVVSEFIDTIKNSMRFLLDCIKKILRYIKRLFR